MSAPSSSTPAVKRSLDDGSADSTSRSVKPRITGPERPLCDQILELTPEQLSALPIELQAQIEAIRSTKAVKKAKLFFSFDIEADGASPLVSSMLSFGLVVFTADGKEIDKLQMNIQAEAGHVAELRCTREFWDKNPHIREFVSRNPQTPRVFAGAIRDILLKYKDTHRIKWIAGPSSYDWQWVNCTYDNYRDADTWPALGYSAKCIGTLFTVYARLKNIQEDMEDDIETAMSKELEEPGHVAHNPEHDARVQGKLFFAVCRELQIAF